MIYKKIMDIHKMKSTTDTAMRFLEKSQRPFCPIRR